jgi:hypothetical protein
MVVLACAWAGPLQAQVLTDMAPKNIPDGYTLSPKHAIRPGPTDILFSNTYATYYADWPLQECANKCKDLNNCGGFELSWIPGKFYCMVMDRSAKLYGTPASWPQTDKPTSSQSLRQYYKILPAGMVYIPGERVRGWNLRKVDKSYVECLQECVADANCRGVTLNRSGSKECWLHEVQKGNPPRRIKDQYFEFFERQAGSTVGS